jgi:hypothetical protein
MLTVLVFDGATSTQAWDRFLFVYKDLIKNLKHSSQLSLEVDPAEIPSAKGGAFQCVYSHLVLCVFLFYFVFCFCLPDTQIPRPTSASLAFKCSQIASARSIKMRCAFISPEFHFAAFCENVYIILTAGAMLCGKSSSVV